MFYPLAKSNKGVRWKNTKNNTLCTAVSARNNNFLARNRLPINAFLIHSILYFSISVGGAIPELSIKPSRKKRKQKIFCKILFEIGPLFKL